jgi:hypothetical protein
MNVAVLIAFASGVFGHKLWCTFWRALRGRHGIVRELAAEFAPPERDKRKKDRPTVKITEVA